MRFNYADIKRLEAALFTTTTTALVAGSAGRSCCFRTNPTFVITFTALIVAYRAEQLFLRLSACPENEKARNRCQSRRRLILAPLVDQVIPLNSLLFESLARCHHQNQNVLSGTKSRPLHPELQQEPRRG